MTPHIYMLNYYYFTCDCDCSRHDCI